jgi:hypothetical protein
MGFNDFDKEYKKPEFKEKFWTSIFDLDEIRKNRIKGTFISLSFLSLENINIPCT